MKNTLVFISVIFLIVGCSNKNAATPVKKDNVSRTSAIPEGVDVVIKENFFITAINDIYLNRNDFMGKTIMLEGVFKYGEEEGREYCYVVRYGPGCCGDDGLVGFEVAWGSPIAGGKKTYPETDSWVQAKGVLSKYDEMGSSFIYLSLKDMNTLEKRGIEYVSR